MSGRAFDDTLKSILETGEITLQGQFLLGSNYTFLVKVSGDESETPAVYKPQKGEQPLWDFPENTLAGREVAAYLLSQALGWELVPLTIFRQDGPFGPGSLQQYIEYDSEYHYFNLSDDDRQRLRVVALFDLLINNADRKGSHVLIENDSQHLWLIDHGLCFHSEDKLRTVIWDFAGEHMPDDLLRPLQSLPALLAQSPLRDDLAVYLQPGEIAALAARAARLVRDPIYPHPPEDRRAFPWPPV